MASSAAERAAAERAAEERAAEERAAEERAAELAATVWELSPREREIQRLLGERGALESTISQPHRGASVKAETTEEKDQTHGSVRNG